MDAHADMHNYSVLLLGALQPEVPVTGCLHITAWPHTPTGWSGGASQAPEHVGGPWLSKISSVSLLLSDDIFYFTSPAQEHLPNPKVSFECVDQTSCKGQRDCEDAFTGRNNTPQITSCSPNGQRIAFNCCQYMLTLNTSENLEGFRKTGTSVSVQVGQRRQCG